ncbi:hypothetical protein [Chitinimonas sp.]|uniref:hypothetical protein n=1 Tax=Chitinimonas sp. TaxID=1934313 RepID=UPI0035B25B84
MTESSTEQLIYEAALAQRGVAAVVIAGVVEFGGLVATLPGHFFDGSVNAADLADKIAAAEIALGQLRAAVGDGLVDLAKIEQLSHLAGSLE